METKKPDSRRKRYSWTMKAEIVEEFQRNIAEYGLPKYSVGIVIQQLMENMNAEIAKNGMAWNLELFNEKK